MAIRIKSERVHLLAKTLAAMTGETQVAAIQRALEERLANIRHNRHMEHTRSNSRDVLQDAEKTTS